MPGSIAGTLNLLLLIMIVPIVLILAAFFYGGYNDRRAAEFKANLELARAVAAAFDAHIDDIVRQELAIGLAMTGSLGQPASEAGVYLVANAGAYATVRDFSWLTAQGTAVFSSDPRSVGLNFADRRYFQAVAAGKEWAASDLLMDKAKGQPVFVVARGIRDSQGRLQGVVTAVIDSNRLGDLLPVARAEQASVGVSDGRGWGVYRYPEVPMTWEQRNWIAQDPTVAPALAGKEVTGTFVWFYDGQTRMVARVPIRSIGWVAGAASLEAETMAPVIRDTATEFGLVLFVVLGAFLLSLTIGRHLTAPLQRLREHAVAVGQGDFEQHVAVAKPAELRDLANAFNIMAQEIGLREEEREGYVHAISHDLRNPLTAVQGQAQLLLHRAEKAELPAYVQTGAEAVLVSARRMNVMIQDLVDTARLQSGQLRLNTRPLALAPFLDEAIERLSGSQEAERVRIDLAPDLPLVLADPDRLERVVVNLLSNALKYSAADSAVTVAARADGDQVVVSVTDQGAGIPPEEVPLVFERFYRAEGTREHREGLGLGLHIVRGLVEAHGGRTWVESQLGRGSTFHFTLPAQRGEEG
ncbi:MAG: ATP-binding protein [Chloroflexi bacterium]|nr:ATP-binding protein [Chloroflexota bacterium]